MQKQRIKVNQEEDKHKIKWRLKADHMWTSKMAKRKNKSFPVCPNYQCYATNPSANPSKPPC